VRSKHMSKKKEKKETLRRTPKKKVGMGKPSPIQEKATPLQQAKIKKKREWLPPSWGEKEKGEKNSTQRPPLCTVDKN